MTPVELKLCPICHHGYFEGEKCRGCQEAKTHALAKKLQKPLPTHSLERKLTIARQEINAVNQIREELKSVLEMPHFMADYVVITWKLGHKVNRNIYKGEQYDYVMAGIHYLNNKYGRQEG